MNLPQQIFEDKVNVSCLSGERENGVDVSKEPQTSPYPPILKQVYKKNQPDWPQLALLLEDVWITGNTNDFACGFLTLWYSLCVLLRSGAYLLLPFSGINKIVGK